MLVSMPWLQPMQPICIAAHRFQLRSIGSRTCKNLASKSWRFRLCFWKPKVRIFRIYGLLYTFFDKILISEPHSKFLHPELATSKWGRDAIIFGKSSGFRQAPPWEKCSWRTSCQPSQQHFFLHIISFQFPILIQF